MHKRKIILILVIAVCSLGTHYLRDDPVIKNIRQYPQLAEWVSLQKKNAIFSVPFGPLTQVFPIFYKRGIYAGHAFPFNESNMIEFCIRDQFLYGSNFERAALRGTWIGQSITNVYRSRTAENFIFFADKYPLDFVVVEKGFDKQLSLRAPPIFSGDGFNVYSISEFRSRGIQGAPPSPQNTICSQFLLF
jgi:hypothetical protein